MITVMNGCRISPIKVTPKNWNRVGASTSKYWRIYYRFYDPMFPDPKFVEIKSGINYIKDLQERRVAVKGLIEQEMFKLQHQGYNPITNRYVAIIDIDYEIDPDTPFIKALEKAKDKLSVSKEVKIDMKAALKVMKKAADQLRLSIVPISKIGIRHLTMLMDQCGQINKRWSARRHNMYRSFLIMMFKKLTKLEACTGNPAREIDIEKSFKKMRTVLNEAQRKTIDTHLRENYYRFWCFVNLYFHSGGRMTEILQQKQSTVDLTRQKYKCVIKKGKFYKEVERTIKNIAVPFWAEFLRDCKEDEYLFGVDFKPSSKPMSNDTAGRWWKRIVKDGLKINVDMYSLKHLNTDEISASLGMKDAAKLNQHDEQTARIFYAVGEEERQHQRLKTVNNSFA